jgi:hypothetical protein
MNVNSLQHWTLGLENPGATANVQNDFIDSDRRMSEQGIAIKAGYWAKFYRICTSLALSQELT